MAGVSMMRSPATNADRVLQTYADHYNRLRPHRGLGLSAPLPETDNPTPVQAREVQRRDVLGGLIHEYHRAAA
jgi:putative transposase